MALRSDLAANWATTNPVLALNEAGVESDTGKVRVGDGVTPWVLLPRTVLTPADATTRYPVQPIESKSDGLYITPAGAPAGARVFDATGRPVVGGGQPFDPAGRPLAVGAAPTLAAGAQAASVAAGAGGVTDSAGSVTAAALAVGMAAGAVVIVTFAAAYAATPKAVLITETSGVSVGLYVSARTAGGFTVSSRSAATASAALAFDFHVLG